MLFRMRSVGYQTSNTTKINFEPTELDIPIYGDKVRMFQVVSNLDQCLKVYKEW